jgi:hypothetical protein
LLSALVVFGVKAFNQSKNELKYWKWKNKFFP